MIKKPLLIHEAAFFMFDIEINNASDFYFKLTKREMLIVFCFIKIE